MVSLKSCLCLILGSLTWNASVFSDEAGLQLAEKTQNAPSYEPDQQVVNSCQLNCCPEKKPVCWQDSRFEIGANYTYVNLNPQGHRTFKGSLGGIQALYEYRPLNFLYGGAKFTWREGNPKGSLGHRSLLYIDAQERLGYTFACKDNRWLFTLFSGFGYRHLDQKFKPKTGSSVRFNYNEFYVPVGFLSDYVVDSLFTIGVGLTWMPQVYPTVTITPLKGARWILTNRLNNFFVEIPLTFSLTDDKRFSLILNPFYEHWEDGHSTAKAGGVSLGLPGNIYNFWGIELNFSYRF